jgi:hypothetical protein
MSMKSLADKATKDLHDRMNKYTSSFGPTADEVSMAAMVCRIQELENKLLNLGESIND